MKYGFYADVTPASFVSYGCLNMYLGHHGQGLRFVKLGLALMDKEDSRYAKAFNYTNIHGLGLHYRQPIEDVYQPLLDGYLSGIRYGDTGHALIAANVSCIVKLMVGAPLGELEKLLHRYVGLTKAYNRTGVFTLTCSFHQLVLNLMDRSNNATILTGTAMNQAELEVSGNEVAMVLLVANIFQGCCTFEKWEVAHKCSGFQPLLRLKTSQECL